MSQHTVSSFDEELKDVAAGFQEGMPAYVGVLGEAEIESLVLYIQSLGN